MKKFALNSDALSALQHTQGDWRHRGACREADTDMFFHPDLERGPAREARAAAAKAVCGRCPVLEQCRNYALAAREPYGTWGGLDEIERTLLFRAHRRGTHTATA